MEEKLILASASPRRQEILRLMGIDYIACPVDVDEKTDAGAEEAVRLLSCKKAMAAAETHPGQCVMGSDTLVTCEGKVLGKPKDREDALHMLMHLSGRMNTVYTGVTVIDKNGNIDTRVDESRVYFVKFTEASALRYIASGEPMDKAGAYGVQGMGGMFVEKVEGSPSNVIGLPMHLVREMLTKIGWQL